MIDMTIASHELLVLLALANWIVCSGIGLSCVCRFAAMSRSTTRMSYRVSYALLWTAACASGWSPLLFREWPGPGQIAMAAAALYVLGSGLRSWRDGVPEYARSGPMPLDDAASTHVVGRGKDSP